MKTKNTMAIKILKSVKIGTQTWAAKNLNVRKFRNGDPIFEAQSDEEWQKAGEEGKPAWCYLDNDPANSKLYGKMYNWFAVSDERGLAPKGWHVPTDAEWTVLTDYLGGSELAATKMKSARGWDNHCNGTNSTGFRGLIAAYRYSNGAIDQPGAWWSSSEVDSNSAWNRGLSYDNSNVFRFDSYKLDGLFVRCLMGEASQEKN